MYNDLYVSKRWRISICKTLRLTCQTVVAKRCFSIKEHSKFIHVNFTDVLDPDDELASWAFDTTFLVLQFHLKEFPDVVNAACVIAHLKKKSPKSYTYFILRSSFGT